MKCPTGCGLARSWRRLTTPAVQRFSMVVAAASMVCGPARAQLSPPDNPSARSISGQFLVTRPEQASPLAGLPRIAADTNLVRLEPALLTVSAERLKEQLWRQL